MRLKTFMLIRCVCNPSYGRLGEKKSKSRCFNEHPVTHHTKKPDQQKIHVQFELMLDKCDNDSNHDMCASETSKQT